MKTKHGTKTNRLCLSRHSKALDLCRGQGVYLACEEPLVSTEAGTISEDRMGWNSPKPEGSGEARKEERKSRD